MHALIARGTGTGWISGPAQRGLHDRPRRPPSRRSPSTGPTSSSSPRPTTPPAPRSPAETVLALYEAAQAAKPSMVVVDEAYVEFSHRRLAAAAARGPAEPRRLPDDVQGVRRGRAAPRLPRRRTRPSSTPSSWSGCRTTCPPSPRRPRWPPWSTPTRCSGTSSSSRPSGTGWSTELRAIGYEVTDSDANFVQFGRFDGRARGLAADPRPGRPGPGQRRTGMAAGHRRHPRRERRVPRRGT